MLPLGLHPSGLIMKQKSASYACGLRALDPVHAARDAQGGADHQEFGDILGSHQADESSSVSDGQGLGARFLQAQQGHLDHVVRVDLRRIAAHHADHRRGLSLLGEGRDEGVPFEDAEHAPVAVHHGEVML